MDLEVEEIHNLGCSNTSYFFDGYYGDTDFFLETVNSLSKLNK